MDKTEITEFKDLHEARISTNKLLAEITHINSNTYVLDAGCGIGDSAVWLAKNLGANVVGITLSIREKEEALKLARKEGVSHLTEFYVKDFFQTGLPNNSFDVVWAIESVCYADDKKYFLKEAYRVLKMGGKLVVADGFLNREVRNSEQHVYNEFLRGFILPNLTSMSDFESSMRKVGFSNLKIWSKTNENKKSSRSLYRRFSLRYPFFKIVWSLRLIPESLIKRQKADIAQYLLESGLCGFGIFYGEKS